MKTATAKSSYEKLTETGRGRRLLEEELLLTSATELICELLETRKVSRSELARRIGRSKAFVTQLLQGRHNMTLRTLADLACALGTRVQLRPVIREVALPVFKMKVAGSQPDPRGAPARRSRAG